MKKAALVFCGMFMVSSLSFAMPPKHDGMGPGPGPMNKEERQQKMEMMKKDFMEFHKNLENLITKYNESKGKKRDGVKNEIRQLVATQTEKDIAMKKEMLAVQKARIDDLQKKIADIEADKEAYINKKVDFYVSDEGQKKIKEKWQKINKNTAEMIKVKAGMNNQGGLAEKSIHFKHQAVITPAPAEQEPQK